MCNARRSCSAWPSVVALATVARLAISQPSQNACDTTGPKSIRVENVADVNVLGSAVDCTDGGAVDVVWAGPIAIGESISVGAGTFLSITGADQSAEILADGSQVRMFDVAPSAGLSLTQVKLTGGAAENGGAIHSSMATLLLDTCVFEGNVAAGGDGGAVWAEGGELTVVGGEFRGNSASGKGGAILTVGASLVVQADARFEGNTAVEGGALYCEGVETPEVGGATAASCSLSEAVFLMNNASREVAVDVSSVEAPWGDLRGGGAAAFRLASVDIRDSVFELNHAQLAGGGVFGGNDTDVAVDGCTFKENTTPGYGGGMAASSASLGGDTLLANNSASYGGGIFGWDSSGTIIYSDAVCSSNAATEGGGCFYATGNTVVDIGAMMEGNTATDGGGVHASGGSFVKVDGGMFTMCHATNQGGFLFASDGSTVTVVAGTIANNVADKEGAGVHCASDFGMGGSNVVIEGGEFSRNNALEGGAVMAQGASLTVTGGLFRNNFARLYGGAISVNRDGNLTCAGATIANNSVGDQGGGIYARDARWVDSSCHFVGNGSPQGAAAYLTNVRGATFENSSFTGNIASGGSVVYVAETSVVTNGVTFGENLAAGGFALFLIRSSLSVRGANFERNLASGGSLLYATESSVRAVSVSFQPGTSLQEDSSNRAIQLEGNATLVAERCVFSGWLGDSVVYSRSLVNGSLVLDSCDFSQSSALTVVASPHSDAEIRNAVVSQRTIENAAIVNDSLVLVDRAMDCAGSNPCGPGQCVDSALGVLCECLDDNECLGSGGALSIELETPPLAVTYSPDLVSFELRISAARDGTTPSIWDMAVETDKLAVQAFPSSGILPLGGSVTVVVTASALRPDTGGESMSRFVVTSVGDGDTGSTNPVEIKVRSSLFLCRAFEYAVPLNGSAGGAACEQCATLQGTEGVDCKLPGATLGSLPVRPGYWRSSRESPVVHLCLNFEACIGATQVSSSDDYCEEGYSGPYCAVCSGGYGKGVGNTCHSCNDTAARLLIAVAALFAVVVLVLLGTAVVFLVGGFDAVQTVRRSMARTLSVSGHSTIWPSGRSVGGNATMGDAGVPPNRSSRPAAPAAMGGGQPETGGTTSQSGCCRLGEKIKRWGSRLPMDKIKILVVVWQILTAFPDITGVDYPPTYSRFLSWIDVVNFDLGNVLSASCVLPNVNFYHSLLITTLSPIILAAVLMLTYWMAMAMAGVGMAGSAAKRAAWSRHMTAGLLLTFLVFTSASTMVVKTFACDEEAVEGESYLRADYSISCKSRKHTYYQVYAGFMILVYPIGIPLLYALILWQNRESLNPRLSADADAPPEVQSGRYPSQVLSLEEKLRMRRESPDLVPSMFLWKDFDPDLYYYEVIECCRRLLLTGVLVFVAPHTAAQAAMASTFAFASIFAFELMRPHLDPMDSWLYRLGCVVIFLSNFLALLIKVDTSGESNQALYGGLLVAVNVFLIVGVLFSSWWSTQQAVDDSRTGDNPLFIMAVENLRPHRRRQGMGARDSSCPP